MPISSGAGGKPNSYFNPSNALSRRPSVSSGGGGGVGGNYNGSGTSPGYYYGSYGGAEPVAVATIAGAAATPRGVQVLDMSGRVPQNGQASVVRESPGRRCCPCPARSRPEMRMPNMPKSKLGTAGGAVTRHGCCIFLIGLLALATAAGLIAGLYFLCTELTAVRSARGAFYLVPGRRAGDLMWVIYGTLQECQPVTTAGSTTASTTTTTPTTTTATTVTGTVTTRSTAATTVTTTASTTSGTTLISCASTTYRYQQVTLSGVRSQHNPLLLLLLLTLAASAGQLGCLSLMIG